MGHPVFCAHIIHQTLTYLKSHNKFHEDISIPKGLYSKDMFRFSSAFETQGETESVTEKYISSGKEMSENINDTTNEIEFASLEDPLIMHRTATNEATAVSQITNITDEETVTIAPRQRKIVFSILTDEFCEKQAFPYLPPKCKCGFHARFSKYSNKSIKGYQILISILHQIQIIFFVRPVYNTLCQ